MRQATQIFAHRGANRQAAENTRSAFDQALKYAIDGMETDVQLTRDEVAVLWHDRFLGKLGLPDKHIDDFDYVQLRAMDFAQHFAPASKPEGVMSLEEFLAAYRQRCHLLIEIKNRAWEAAARHELKVRKTLDLIGTSDGSAILVSSFDLDSLIHAHRYRAGIPLVYNLEPEHRLTDAQHVLDEQPFLHGLCLPIAILDAAMVTLLHGRGKCIAVYTCNDDEEIGKALDLGVDILISDVPQKALHLRDA